MELDDKEILFECWALKGNIKEEKRGKVNIKGWKRCYCRLQREGVKAVLCTFNSKPKQLHLPRKGVFPLSPFFLIHRYYNQFGKTFICRLRSLNDQLFLAFEDEKLFRVMTFFIQTQMKISDEILGECYVARPHTSAEHEMLGSRKRHCLLHVSSSGILLALELERCVLAYWPLYCVRTYEVNNERGIFQIQVGEESCTGEGTFAFVHKSNEANMIYEQLDGAVLELAGLNEILSSQVSTSALGDGFQAAITEEKQQLSHLVRVESNAAVCQRLRKISKDIYDQVQEHLGMGAPRSSQSSITTNMSQVETSFIQPPGTGSSGPGRGNVASTGWTFEATGPTSKRAGPPLMKPVPQSPDLSLHSPGSMGSFQDEAARRIAIERLDSSYLKMGSHRGPVEHNEYEVENQSYQVTPPHTYSNTNRPGEPRAQAEATHVAAAAVNPYLNMKVNTPSYYMGCDPDHTPHHQQQQQPAESHVKRPVKENSYIEGAAAKTHVKNKPSYGDSYSLESLHKGTGDAVDVIPVPAVRPVAAPKPTPAAKPTSLMRPVVKPRHKPQPGACTPELRCKPQPGACTPRLRRQSRVKSQSSEDLTNYERMSRYAYCQSVVGDDVLNEVNIYGDYSYVPQAVSLGLMQQASREQHVSGFSDPGGKSQPGSGWYSLEKIRNKTDSLAAQELGLSATLNPDLCSTPGKVHVSSVQQAKVEDLYAKVVPKDRRRSRSFPQTLPELATSWKSNHSDTSPQSPGYALITDVVDDVDGPLVVKAKQVPSVEGFSVRARGQAPSSNLTKVGNSHSPPKDKNMPVSPPRERGVISPSSASPRSEGLLMSMFQKQNSNSSTASAGSSMPSSPQGISFTAKSRKFTRNTSSEKKGQQALQPVRDEGQPAWVEGQPDPAVMRIKAQNSMANRRLPSLPPTAQGEGLSSLPPTAEGEHPETAYEVMDNAYVYDEIKATMQSKC